MAQIPRSVLVAVDFGDASARAVAIGGFIATTCGAALRLLHAEALEAPAHFTSEQLNTLERQRQATRAQAEAFVSTFGREHTAVPFSVVIDSRSPVDAIVNAALTTDVVVMGTHGRHGVGRWWLGSVAERVLREIGRPPLIVRADITQPVELLFARILVHASAPLIGASTLDHARVLAARVHGEVVDGRYDLIEPALDRTGATLLAAAAPQPRTPAWLSNHGEPLVRFATMPILFVPESTQGASS